MKTFPNYLQGDSKDCGANCLKIIAKHYNKFYNIQELRDLTQTTREGISLSNLSESAEKIGFRTLGIKINLHKLKNVPLPCILHWNKEHFVVLYKIKKGKFFISDPAVGLIEYNTIEFLNLWIGINSDNDTDDGIALLLQTTPTFINNEKIGNEKNLFGFSFLLQYILPYKAFLIQLMIGLLALSLIELIFPFLTQSIVDVGIQNQNMQFVYLVLFSQLFLFFGKIALDIIRSWIILHLSTRINISLISDFFIKLMKLPISYFDVRLTGDIIQRINDHHRIERLLTTSSLNIILSIVNMLILGSVLAYYNLKIFLVFFTGSFLYFVWAILFLKRREKLDYKRFSEISQEQSKVIELINGMQEIKLHNAEKQKRWGWEYVQARLFKVSLKGLVLEQTQTIGSSIINQLKNIFIIFLSAKLVIDGQITLGMMLAISSIVGSLDGPIVQLINFIREVQDAKISLARLSEIHEKEDESQQEENQTHDFPKNANIEIKDVSFRYIGSDLNVLEHLNLTIPAHKITAIVGTSGSGKTTLMKLLLKFYEPNDGEISLCPSPALPKEKEVETENSLENSTQSTSSSSPFPSERVGEGLFPPSGRAGVGLKNLAQRTWRANIGAVMQEGYIFNDTIANNIAIGVDFIDKERLQYAADVANIKDYILSLPLGYNTKTGMEGVGMSTGQKQRLLIARAVYKNPEMLFFDEATSALDANNEKEIMQKLNIFFKNKTVVVIAHRLSTVMNADQIVVLEKGQIVEIGNHKQLVELKGSYFELVRNQLQLGT